MPNAGAERRAFFAAAGELCWAQRESFECSVTAVIYASRAHVDSQMPGIASRPFDNMQGHVRNTKGILRVSNNQPVPSSGNRLEDKLASIISKRARHEGMVIFSEETQACWNGIMSGIQAAEGASMPLYRPLMLLQLFYKLTWLIGVGSPLWSAGHLDPVASWTRLAEYHSETCSAE